MPPVVVLAPDSFKESMTAVQATEAMAAGVRDVWPDAELRLAPMADGGEGTAATLAGALGGRLVEVDVHDPLGRPVRAALGLVPARGLAVVEVATAIGLALLAPWERDPTRTSSAGAGELLRAALDLGAERIVVGLGGTATNDGGAGALAALGVVLRDELGAGLAPVPASLPAVRAVDLTGLDPRWATTRVELACDVRNPLLGPRGATAVFGPQKGLRADRRMAAEAGLARWAAALASAALGPGSDLADRPGAGAAGGLGAALLALGGRMRPGVEVVAEAIGLADLLHGCDLVLTGEGRIDAQTMGGKVPSGVAALARAAAVPVLAFAGSLGPGADQLLAAGAGSLTQITPAGLDLAVALREGPTRLRSSVADELRRWAGRPTTDRAPSRA